MAAFTLTHPDIPIVVRAMRWTELPDLPSCRQTDRLFRDRLEYLLSLFLTLDRGYYITEKEKDEIILLDDNLKLLIGRLYVTLNGLFRELELKHIIVKDVEGDITLILN